MNEESYPSSTKGQWFVGASPGVAGTGLYCCFALPLLETEQWPKSDCSAEGIAEKGARAVAGKENGLQLSPTGRGKKEGVRLVCREEQG